jgi:D-alanine transaminase
MRLITVEDRRHGYCDIKTIDLLPAVLASTKAENCGCDEAIFVRNGIVTECEKSNISIIKQGRLITHPITSEILPGITRRHLLSICAEISIPVSEDYFTPIDLINADEVIITSTTKLCRSAVSIDGFAVGGKDTKLKNAISNRMLDEYKSFCFG